MRKAGMPRNDIAGFATKTIPFNYSRGGRGHDRFPEVRHF